MFFKGCAEVLAVSEASCAAASLRDNAGLAGPPAVWSAVKAEESLALLDGDPLETAPLERLFGDTPNNDDNTGGGMAM